MTKPQDDDLDFGTPHPDDVKAGARNRPRNPGLYRVIVADNYYYQDPDEEYVGGDFATDAEALAFCKSLVDASLREHLQPGTTAAQIFSAYKMFGDDPFIIGPLGAAPAERFSAWEYARVRSHELVATEL